MTRKEQIKSAYKQLGGSASFYDGSLLRNPFFHWVPTYCSTFPSRNHSV